jgi:hypothetical protein
MLPTQASNTRDMCYFVVVRLSPTRDHQAYSSLLTPQICLFPFAAGKWQIATTSIQQASATRLNYKKKLPLVHQTP